MRPQPAINRGARMSQWLRPALLAIAATAAFTPPDAAGTVFYSVTWEDSSTGAPEVGAEANQPSEIDPGIAATITSAADVGGPTLPTGRFLRCLETAPNPNASAVTFDRGIAVHGGQASVSMTLLLESPDYYEIQFRSGRASNPLGPDAQTLCDIWFLPDGKVRWVSEADGGSSEVTYLLGKPIEVEARFDFETHSASISVDGRPLSPTPIPINPAYALGRTRVGFGHSSPSLGAFQLDDFRFSATTGSGCEPVVTSTADGGPGTLRAAIDCANQRPGRDTIRFAIPGDGPHVIAPSTPLPPVTDSVVVDGWTQPGTRKNSRAAGGLDAVVAVVIDGRNLAGTGDGLVIEADGCDVLGLEIRGFPQAGIRLLGSGGRVQGSVLGGGRTRTPNQHGIVLLGRGNLVGGSDPADRCQVAANAYSGVWIEGSDNIVEGCLVGLSQDGLTQAPNGTPEGNGAGVFVSAGNSNRVLRSVVSGNFQSNVLVAKGLGHSIQQCVIGLDASGSTGMPSPAYYGVVVQAAHLTRILESTISGNESGLTVAAGVGTVVQGNRIGLNNLGQPAPNTRWGILLETGSRDTTIGGTGVAQANVIANNGSEGILVAGDTTGNRLSANRIHANGGMGIDLCREMGADRGDGVDRRDPLDLDEGPNRGLNAPRLATATYDSSWMSLDGTLEGPASEVVTLQFFANHQAHASGSGEGEWFVGEAQVLTDVTGKAVYSVTLSAANLGLPGPGAPGVYFTATATDSQGNTSEFSEAVWADAPLGFECIRFDLEAAGEKTSPWTVGGVRVEGDGLRVAENLPAGRGLYVADRVQLTLPAPCPRVLLEVANFANLKITALDASGTNIIATGLAPENSVSQILLGPDVASLAFNAPATEASILGLCCLEATPPKPRIASVSRSEGLVKLKLVGLARGRTVRVERAEQVGRPWQVVGTFVAKGDTDDWTEDNRHEEAYYRLVVL